MTVPYDHMTPVQAFVDGTWQVAVVRMECGPPSRPTALVSLLDHDVGAARGRHARPPAPGQLTSFVVALDGTGRRDGTLIHDRHPRT